MQSMEKKYIVETQKLQKNIELIRARAGEAAVYAVVKCDGYGTGCRALTRVCASSGLRRFAVTEVREAQIVAQEAAPEELLMLTCVSSQAQIEALAQCGATFTVASQADAALLEEYCAAHDVELCAHIKIDTGMGRRGFLPQEHERLIELYRSAVHLRFTGIFTHFAYALDPKATQEQYDKFCVVLHALAEAGIDPGVRHCCNSIATFRYPQMALDAVRVGSALLGRIPGGERYGLERTGMCVAPIESVRTLPKGASIGYGGIFRTRKPTRVALCAVGGHNGFALALKPGQQSVLTGALDTLAIVRNRLTGRDIPTVRIAGRSCRVLGCICSEAVMIDVTGVPCEAGDAVLLDINPLMRNDMDVEYV